MCTDRRTRPDRPSVEKHVKGVDNNSLWAYNTCMNSKTTPRKTLTYAGVNFLLPFACTGFYVSDARGTTVCEVNDQKVGKELTKYLNDLGKNQAPIVAA